MVAGSVRYITDLLPWDEQDPELEEGDILPSSDKNALVDVNKHWPNAQVPYVISSNFSKLSYT